MEASCNIQIEKAMKLAEGQIEIMKEDMSEDLIKMLMANWHYSMDDAMDVLYNSPQFRNPTKSLRALRPKPPRMRFF